MAVRHHRGRADEGEIPADAEQGKGDPKMPERNSGDPDQSGDDDEGEPRPGDSLEPEAGNKRAGGEARRIHAEHVPLQAERRIGDRMIAHNHGQRRRGHHQIHHGIGCDPAGDRHDKTRLLYDFGQRATLPRRRARRRLRYVHEHQHAGRDQGEGRLAEIGRGEEIGRPQILGRDDELRSNDGGNDAAK